MRAAGLTGGLLAVWALAGAALAAPPAQSPHLSPEIAQSRAASCRDALKGDQEQAFRMAQRYILGVGVTKNLITGVSWLRVASAMGHGEAQRLLLHVPRGVGLGSPPACSGGLAGSGGGRSPALPAAEVRAMVDRLAPQYGLDPKLVLAVMQIESGFRANVISPKAAAGLMQLIPATAERFGVIDVFNPEDNARGGMKYLRWLLAYFRGDVILATAAYNAGERAVDRHGGVPPYDETRNYVRLIRQIYGMERHPFDPAAAGESSPLVKSGKG